MTTFVLPILVINIYYVRFMIYAQPLHVKLKELNSQLSFYFSTYTTHVSFILNNI